MSRKERYIYCVWRKEVASSQATPRKFDLAAVGKTPRLQDKIWEWPWDEARYKSERDLIV